MRPRWEPFEAVAPPPQRGRPKVAMSTIQLALKNRNRATELQLMLAASSSCRVECVAEPDWQQSGVLVVDEQSLSALPRPLERPERVVLITHDDPAVLKSAWEAGVSSVVFDRDPLSTVVLAILSACLRITSPKNIDPSNPRSGRS